MSLSHSQLQTGEAFDETSLHAAMAELKYSVLLYPPDIYDGHEVPAPLDSAQLDEPSKVRLVVLDATWRKSRKMLHLSPMLQRLPRYSLNVVPLSGYAIRKAHKPGQLSTLEATCAALAQLEGDSAKFQPLLAAFDGFVTQQLAFMKKNGL